MTDDGLNTRAVKENRRGGRPEYKREQEVSGIIARAKERAPFNLSLLRKLPRQRPPRIGRRGRSRFSTARLIKARKQHRIT